jgi:hypothetical protein
MYQQYANEARVAQYQQQCQRQAAAERSLRSSHAQQEGGEPSDCAAESFLARLLCVLQYRFECALSQKRIVKTR